MIKSILLVFMMFISVSLIAVILLQKKGSGLGSVFGGTSEAYRSKRGAEKILYYLTIILGFLFASVSIVLLFI